MKKTFYLLFGVLFSINSFGQAGNSGHESKSIVQAGNQGHKSKSTTKSHPKRNEQLKQIAQSGNNTGGGTGNRNNPTSGIKSTKKPTKIGKALAQE